MTSKEDAKRDGASRRSRDAVAPLFTRNFVLLIAAHFLQALGYASMLLLPLYLEHLSARRFEIGAIMATAAVAGLLTRPFVAWSLDRWGRRPTLIVGTAVLSIGMGLLVFVDRISWLIYLERAVVGVGVGTLFSAYFTYAADLIPESRRTEGLALFGISGLVPLLVNPIAAGLSIEAAQLRWFLPAIGGVIALSLIPLAILPESPIAAHANKRSMSELLVELAAKSLWAPWLATVAFATFVAVFMTFATVVAAHRGVANAPTLWLAYALGAVSVRLFGAKLPDRVGTANVLMPALATYIVALFVAAFAGTLAEFMVAALLAGIGHGYCFPVLASQVVSRTSVAFRGTAIATFTALWGLSELLTSPLMGAVADAYGDVTMFAGVGVFGVVSLFAWMVLEHRYAPRLGRAVEP